jgi:hypothetical protein
MSWKNQWWTTAMQEQLNLEAAVLEAIEMEQSRHRDEDAGLSFGPYGCSPITGLHFDTADDTAAS